MKHVEDWDLLGQRWGWGWQEQEAVRRWPEVVGQTLQRLARPLYVEQGVLHIAVPSPVVANELRMWEQELLTRLDRTAPASQVRELRFHIVVEEREAPLPEIKPSTQEWNEAEASIPENLPSSLRRRLVQLLAQALAQETAILACGGRRCARCGVAFLGPGEACPLCRLLP